MQKVLTLLDIKQIADLLLNNKIGVLPTDTIYGLHATVNESNIRKIRDLKNRGDEVPFIYLISEINQLKTLNIKTSEKDMQFFKKYWPGKNTLVLNTLNGLTQAIRLPENDFLQKLVKLTGPLISTSANIHGKPSANDINQAINYFAGTVDFYVDGGVLYNLPSNIYKISGNKIEKLR